VLGLGLVTGGLTTLDVDVVVLLDKDEEEGIVLSKPMFLKYAPPPLYVRARFEVSVDEEMDAESQDIIPRPPADLNPMLFVKEERDTKADVQLKMANPPPRPPPIDSSFRDIAVL